MEVAQLFETTIAAVNVAEPPLPAATFIFVPRASFDDQGLLDNPEWLRKKLEFVELLSGALPVALPLLIASVVDPERTGAPSDFLVRGPEFFQGAEWTDLASFSQHLAFAAIIPVQMSPLDLKSAADVLTKGSGAAMGAYAGVVASGGTPLILITFPLGMILGGAAAGIAKALEEGLRELVLGLFPRRSASPA
jgi:hypothetical protein